ncbi:hypothetical protein GGP41_007813 [Bipolaris sorokiniana]|uniref:Uncharacterized protein n=1 Tax=Cochliobolus sativus TaxID=45130 RepID=A0A8H5ZKP6_COCSA|nr:hypothetical protein GGP41_007813 [Bipolaris sorokiniana]
MPPKALSLISALQISCAKNIRRVFNYFCRPRGNSPYDAVFSPGSRDYSPIITRTTITACRPFYLKVFIIYSRGALNAAFYINNCAAILRGEKEFTAFASCVSITSVKGSLIVLVVVTSVVVRLRVVPRTLYL